MASLTKLVSFAGLILVLVLVTIASYAFSDIVHLSLPISQILASFTVLLPIATGASLYSVRRLLRVHAANLGRTRPTIYLILLLAFQLIYETVVATLSLTYMAPASSLSCGLEEQWKRLYMSKDGAAVRRIQDRFDCCGFNSLLDRAWPFPHDHLGPEQCQARFDRTRSCAGPWRQAEQINAGLFLIVAAITFATKLFALASYFTTSTTTNNIPWLRSLPFYRVTSGEVEDGRRLIEGGEPQQEYHDEAGSGHARDGEPVVSSTSVNGNRPRIEPSGLLGPEEGWRDGN